MLGLNNGLDSKDDNNTGKGAMAQLFLSPKEGFSIYLNWFGSNEAADGDVKNYFRVFDITTTFQANEKTLLGLNAASGHNASGGWNGAALYVQQSVTAKFGLGLRLEHFDNSSGAIYLTKGETAQDKPIGVSVTSSTLTGNVKMGKISCSNPKSATTRTVKRTV